MNIIRFNNAVFVLDEENSGDSMKEYMTEYNLSKFVIREDLTQHGRPYYDLYHEYKENKRMFRDRLFSSSKLDKIERFFEDNI